MSSNALPATIVVEQKARIMGTDVSVHLAVLPAKQARAQQVIEQCMKWLRKVDKRLTRFDPQSELCQLNASPGRWRQVSPLLFQATKVALAGAANSDGLFDPALAGQMEASGYDRDFDLLSRSASA